MLAGLGHRLRHLLRAAGLAKSTYYHLLSHPAARADGPAQAPFPRTHDHDQRAARRSRGPGNTRSLGRRPDPRRGQQKRDRHARGTPDTVHDPAAPARRARRRTRPAGRHPENATPAQAPEELADLGPGIRTRPAPACDDRIGYAGLPATRTRPGREARTRTPTGSCANASPRAPTWAHTPRTTSTRSPPNSTTGPAKHSATGNQARGPSNRSTPHNTITPFQERQTTQVLQPPLKSAHHTPNR